MDEGRSPLDAAIEVLHAAEDLIKRHTQQMLANVPKELHPQMQADFRKEWAPELSEVLQGLSVARLIFNKDRSGDHLIEKHLNEALELRKAAGLFMKVADTLNSLGMLKDKQKHPAEAHKYFQMSLNVRCDLPQNDEEEAKARQQAIAQSYVSLGNLAIERGDDAAKGGSSETATNFYNQAVADLHSAKAAYTEGFNAEHPKVAWALEGLAKVHLKLGELAEAQRTVDEALVIRRRIQATDPTKEMFRKELDSCVKLHEEILRTGRQMV